MASLGVFQDKGGGLARSQPEFGNGRAVLDSDANRPQPERRRSLASLMKSTSPRYISTRWPARP